jgi:CDP-glycerol glycerophosphotransferase (TagB/SpsB family)
LIAGVDAVLTTPSTVALDAARTGRPVALLAYDLDLPLYAPLPLVRGMDELDAFLEMRPDEALALNEAFLSRTVLPGRADHRVAAAIALAMLNARTAKTRRKSWFSA